MISFEFIQFLNTKALEYLPHNKIRVGNKYNFRCPICMDSKKSATKKRGWWYMQTASFHCFNCGTNLSGIKFLEAISGNDYATIKDEYVRLYLKSGLNSSLSSFAETPKAEPNLFNIKSLIKPEWKNPLSEKAKQYLAKRKIINAPFLIDKLYSWYSKNNDEYILIPWNLNGCEGAYFQLNDFQKLHQLKYIFPKDSKKLVYGLDNIDLSKKYIVVTEGVYDSLFIPNCIATGTKSITQYQYDLIKNRYPYHQIVVSFDCDKAGISSMVKLIKQNKPFKYFIWWNSKIMSKCKDINELVLAKNDELHFTKYDITKQFLMPEIAKLFLIENNLWNITETKQH